MNWDWFDRRIVLTNDEGEYQLALAEFSRVSLEVDRFNALPDIGPHQSFSKSVRQILIDFYESPADRLLHLEDDCVFLELHHLERALRQLPHDWDVVYLGANLICWGSANGNDPKRFSTHLYRVKQAWTTHAIGYNKKVIPFLLENQPGYSEVMFDNWMSTQLEKLNAYVVTPMVAWQRPRWSTIWGRHTDYNDVFIASQNKLR